MRLNKWGIQFMAFMLVVALIAGCSSANTNNGGKSTDQGPDQSQGQTQGQAQGGEKNLSPVTYTFATSNNKMTWDTPVTKGITAATGVSLEYDVMVGDIFQKWDIWRASGDYPDIMRLDALNLQKYIEAEAVIPLEDLIDQYGPNIKEKFGDRLEMLRQEDGHIYSIYSVNLSEEAPADSAGPYVVQMAVLEDAGYPEVKTLDQLYDLIKNYKAKNPKIDGQDTIAYTGAMESYMINHTFNNAAIYSSGRPDHGNFYLDGDNVYWNPTSDMSKRMNEYIFNLMQEGLFDIEAFSMDLEAMQAKMAQGRVLAAYAPNWMVSSVNASLRAEGKEDRMYAQLQLMFDDQIQDQTVSMTPANPGTHDWTITTNAKNPERIIQFIDYLFSDEGQILTNWGVEGIHYEVVDGKRTVLESWLKEKAEDADAAVKNGFSMDTNAKGFWFSVGHGAKLADGDYATPQTSDLVRREYSESTKKTLAAYGAETWSDFLPETQFVPGYVWQMQPPESTRAIGQKLDEEWRKSLPNILMSKSKSEFDTKWDSFVKSAKDAGLDEYNKSFTEAWKQNLSK
jgi:putative aldouronate transport system substrate-binding protein